MNATTALFFPIMMSLVSLSGGFLRLSLSHLPGGRGDRFLRIPMVLVLALLPMLGGLFVVFLPVIGFALVAYALGKKLAALVRGGAADFASTVTPGWRPGEAHLTGKPGQGDKDLPHEHGVGDQALEALRKEIADKRQHEDN